MRSIKTKIITAVILCALVSVAVCGGISVMYTSVTSYEDSKQEMALICENKVLELDSMMKRVAQSVDTLYGIAVEELKDPQLFQRDPAYVEQYTDTMLLILEEFAQQTQGALTAYIRYNPDFTEPTSGLFLSRESIDSTFTSVTPTDFSMYEPSDTAHVGWYYIPVENKKATWMAPYLNSNINVYMISYVVPIYIEGESFGIIGMDIDFSAFVDVLDQTTLFDTGYAFLANHDGSVASHKDLETGSQLTAADSGYAAAVEALADSAKEATIVNYTSQNAQQVMYYRTLVNDMKFILTAPQSELQAQAVQMVQRVLEGSVLALLISVVIGLAMGIRLTNPIKKINQIVTTTAEFDFVNNTAPERLYRRRDETGRMAVSLRKMCDNLKQMLADIKKAYEDMKMAMEQLDQATVQVNRMSEENAETTQELAAAMEETASTMENVNQTIGSVRQRAEVIQERSAGGRDTSIEAKGRADQLKETTSEASNKTTRMYESVRSKSEQAMEQAKAVKRINELTNAILNISGQTNMLALNASIEAARAGDAGRGFAVVANEIGQLAAQTSKTAGDINEIVSQVNQAVTNMSSCLQESTEFLEKTVLHDYSEFMGVAQQYTKDAAVFEIDMTQINSEIDNLLYAIIDIAKAIDGVSQTVMDASSGISNIAHKNQDMTALVIQNNELVANSQQNTKRLKEIIDMFKLQK